MSKLVKRENIFGISPCLAAILAGRRKIYKVWLNEKLSKEDPKRDALCEIIEKSESRGFNIKYKPKIILDRLSRNRPHQNVVIETGRLNFEHFTGDMLSPKTNKDFVLALHEIHDPMNFGAIIRSAYYFGVDKIIVSNKNCCGLTPVVSKASAGAMEWMNVFAVNSMDKFLKESSRFEWDIIGAFKANGNLSRVVHTCDVLQLEKPTILVLGNEGFGLSSVIADICAKLVTIPPGKNTLTQDIDSLNVSVATGVLLYSFLKDRP